MLTNLKYTLIFSITALYLDHGKMEKPREEDRILNDIATLAGSPGYIHAIASIAHRDNIIQIKDKLKPSDMDRLFGSQRLIRTELMTLIGLMVKKPLDLTPQLIDVINSYVKQTDTLMQELHDSISYPMFASIFEAAKAGVESAHPWEGLGMREPIFYGTESAYTFQYRDFVPEKYGADDEWILKNKGFSSDQARIIAKTFCFLMDEKGTRLSADALMTNTPPETWLAAFEFSLEEVVLHSGLEASIVEAFFQAFLFNGNNSGFKEVGDFNEVAAKPLLHTDRGTVILFSYYAICEALYESPFFWMWEDKSYRPIAAKHRGIFTEQFAARRLASVFGHAHVHKNVNLHRGKDIVGEVDILVVYGDRLIILQAKSKKLTIAARKGNDNQLKTDFAAAIQDSYDQGWSCANEILAGGCLLMDDKTAEITIPTSIKDILLISLVSEHYPALAFQVRQSLNYRISDVIRAPFVMDVFLLDTLTEMLETPLRLLSYLKMRVAVSDKLMSGHELTVLGYHLKRNLWLDENHDFVMLEDSVVQDLDAAMMVRRDNLPGDDTPVGILTKMRGTHYENLVKDIEARAESAVLELGFHLLAMGGDSCMNVHCAIEIITKQTKIDGKRHDVTLASLSPLGGITFHCNSNPSSEAIAVLEAYCIKRKYQQRATKWFGVSLSPTGQVQFGVTLDFQWEHSDELEQQTADMKPASKVQDIFPQYLRNVSRMKVGRNSPCPCGSRLKYKKCCQR